MGKIDDRQAAFVNVSRCLCFDSMVIRVFVSSCHCLFVFAGVRFFVFVSLNVFVPLCFRVVLSSRFCFFVPVSVFFSVSSRVAASMP